MKINTFTLRFTLLVVLLRLIIGFAAMLVMGEYFYSIELGINIQTGINIFLLLIEIYLLYYLLIFLNQVLSFKKVNIFLWILIITSFLQIIFTHILKEELDEKGWTRIILVVWGISYAIARIGLLIRFFFYRGAFKMHLILYAIAGVSPLIFQIVLVPLTFILKNPDLSYLPYIIQFLFFLPSIALFFLFYKALKNSNLQEEKSSSSALDGGEFSN